MELKDIRNQTFGRLTAVSPTDKRDHKGSVVWLCSCECGGTTTVTQDRLVRGNTKSCGCLRREVNSLIGDALHFVDGTCIELIENRKSRKDNTSGCSGVSRTPAGRWRASIGFKGKRHYLGYYDSFDEAVQVRKKAEDELHKKFLDEYYQSAIGTAQ